MEYKDYEKTTIMQLLPIVMTSVKQGMNFKRILSLLVVFIMSLASYAQKTVTGNVRDVFGEPMIDATKQLSPCTTTTDPLL